MTITASSSVRLLIPDLETGTAQLFTNDQILEFLEIADDSVKRAAAFAKLTLASSTNLLLKYVKDHDITIDGPKVAAELRAEAETLYRLAAFDDAHDMEDSGFSITVVPYDFEEDAWDSTAS